MQSVKENFEVGSLTLSDIYNFVNSLMKVGINNENFYKESIDYIS
jgi:hypothetical protein